MLTMDCEHIDITIQAEPPSLNHIWRKRQGGMYLTTEARAFRGATLAAIWERRLKAPKDWPYYRVEIIVEPKLRSGDVDNRIKAVLDALTKSGFWEDDQKVAFVSCQFGKVNKAGRTLVRVSPMAAKYQE